MMQAKLHGAEELRGSLQDIANTYPLDMEKTLRRIGDKARRMIAENSPDSGKNNRHKLKKSWKMKISGYTGATLSCAIRSTAPHFHLVDRGHVQKTPGGRVTGFVKGRHFIEQTAQEVETNVAPEEMRKFANKIKKKLGG